MEQIRFHQNSRIEINRVGDSGNNRTGSAWRGDKDGFFSSKGARIR
jgi:hypothetical protein